ncbi:Zinc transport protein ZntB [Thalassovita gelatinovora]|uniref:Zinc transport protein ZntB n=1 Tax=Thalassovita gelatinovora TaxID=53501 RepID=A0A0P1FX18_THAGE|nr:zinc transporter ZntB [Thalassovita gelatinovora]QIZ81394.1 zinc transporter ZntB [Thalassovita gelatinovora]CUH66168.1 Zinc transport protein ZntB [Thalassovita gelatinovora]SEQ20965.1 zinc transporter [Thalassovita gelatinovora]
MLPRFVKFAHALSGPDEGDNLREDALLRVLQDETPAWVHLDGTDPGAGDWIAQHLDYLDAQVIEALLDVDTRPRVSILGSGMLVILRSVNMNEGEKPEDMISIRMWIDAHRIITISRKNSHVIADMDATLRDGAAIESVEEFLVWLVEAITRFIAEFQKDLDLKAENLEERVIAETSNRLGRDVVDLRLQVIAARRFLVPQRAALEAISKAQLDFIDPITRREIEEEALKMTRVVEDMEELREQAAVLREEMSGHLSDRLNRNMFVLSILSAIFLPLGFLTGLFGVNVGGMPGVGAEHAFLWLCVAMGGLFAMQLVLLWRLRWIGGGG